MNKTEGFKGDLVKEQEAQRIMWIYMSSAVADESIASSWRRLMLGIDRRLTPQCANP